MPYLPPPVIVLPSITFNPTVAFSPVNPMALSPPPISIILSDTVTADASPSCNSIPQQLLLVTVLFEIVTFFFNPFQITMPLAPGPCPITVELVTPNPSTGPLAYIPLALTLFLTVT